MDLSKELSEILLYYTDVVDDVVDKVASDVCRDGVKKVKELAPKKRPEYYKGFTSKKIPKGRVIYNKTYPGLTHLLEKGHATRGRKGRTRAFPHMKPTEEFVNKEFEKRLKEGIEKIWKILLGF